MIRARFTIPANYPLPRPRHGEGVSVREKTGMNSRGQYPPLAGRTPPVCGRGSEREAAPKDRPPGCEAFESRTLRDLHEPRARVTIRGCQDRRERRLAIETGLYSICSFVVLEPDVR